MPDRSALERFERQVDRANKALSAQWQNVSNHLGDGLRLPVRTSAVLRKAFSPPDHYPGPDGRQHRKPVRALYGFGDSARQRFDGDVAFFEQYGAGLKSEVDRYNAALDYWMSRARSGEPDAINWYCKTVLPHVLVPFPGGRLDYLRTAYSVEESRLLIIDRYVPGIEVIPEAQRYEIRGGAYSAHSVAVPTSSRGAFYLQFLAQVALLTADRRFRS